MYGRSITLSPDVCFMIKEFVGRFFIIINIELLNTVAKMFDLELLKMVAKMFDYNLFFFFLISVVVDVDDRPVCVEICDTAGQVSNFL